MTSRTFKMDDEALHRPIEGYTREAGVRTPGTDHCRPLPPRGQTARVGRKEGVTVTAELLEPMLGPKKFKLESREADDQIGVATGLAWTSVGGETMPIEVAVLDGTGKVELTGSLGDVMKESARSGHHLHPFPRKGMGPVLRLLQQEGHSHPCAGGSHSQGRSLGRHHHGDRHPLGADRHSGAQGRRHDGGDHPARPGPSHRRSQGKTMAAYRLGMQTVIIPKDNEPDLAEIEPVVRSISALSPPIRLDLVLENALLRLPGSGAAPRAPGGTYRAPRAATASPAYIAQ